MSDIKQLNIIGMSAEGIVMLSAGVLNACGISVCVVDHSKNGLLLGQIRSSKTGWSRLELGGVWYCNSWESICEDVVVVIHFYETVCSNSEIDNDICTYLVLDSDMRLSVYGDDIYLCPLNIVVRDDVGDMPLYNEAIGILNYRCKKLKSVYRLPLCKGDKLCEIRAKSYADLDLRGLSSAYMFFLQGLCRDVGIDDVSFAQFKKKYFLSLKKKSLPDYTGRLC